jgi:hypothetical protein
MVTGIISNDVLVYPLSELFCVYSALTRSNAGVLSVENVLVRGGSMVASLIVILRFLVRSPFNTPQYHT